MNLKLLSAIGVIALAGCATAPSGPTREAFPGRDKSFEQFQIDDAQCREYANVQTGGKSAADRANESAVGSAVVGTALGAAAGALIGGNHTGAGVGAGVGLIAGSAVGSGNAAGAYQSTQRRYDGAYYQCMYAKGNKVPMYGRYVQNAAPRQNYNNPPPPPPPPPPPASSPTIVTTPPANLPPESIPPPNAPPPPRN
jgi:hypothetical protein